MAGRTERWLTMLGLVPTDPMDVELEVEYSEPTAMVTLRLRLMA
jgi:hypothetical protein